MLFEEEARTHEDEPAVILHDEPLSVTMATVPYRSLTPGRDTLRDFLIEHNCDIVRRLSVPDETMEQQAAKAASVTEYLQGLNLFLGYRMLELGLGLTEIRERLFYELTIDDDGKPCKTLERWIHKVGLSPSFCRLGLHMVNLAKKFIEMHISLEYLSMKADENYITAMGHLTDEVERQAKVYETAHVPNHKKATAQQKEKARQEFYQKPETQEHILSMIDLALERPESVTISSNNTIKGKAEKGMIRMVLTYDPSTGLLDWPRDGYFTPDDVDRLKHGCKVRVKIDGYSDKDYPGFFDIEHLHTVYAHFLDLLESREEGHGRYTGKSNQKGRDERTPRKGQEEREEEEDDFEEEGEEEEPLPWNGWTREEEDDESYIDATLEPI